MDGDALVLELLHEGRANDQKLLETLNGLKQEIVGIEKCAEYRKIDKADYEKLESRLKAIEDKLKPFELTWNTVKSNPVLLTTFAGGAMMFVGVMSGRGYDLVQLYGIHAVLLGLGIVSLGLISAWITRRRTKSALKKVGLWHMLIILALISPVLAQENESIEIIETTRPIAFGPEQVQAASDLLWEELAVLAGHEIWLGNDSLNITATNGTLFYA